MHIFRKGDRVQLAEQFHVGLFKPVGTVIDFPEDDVMVRWDTGLEAALAPWSLAPATPPENPT